jgi:hypothetical protein
VGLLAAGQPGAVDRAGPLAWEPSLDRPRLKGCYLPASGTSGPGGRPVPVVGRSTAAACHGCSGGMKPTARLAVRAAARRLVVPRRGIRCSQAR